MKRFVIRFLVAALLSLLSICAVPAKPKPAIKLSAPRAQLGPNGVPQAFFFDADFTKNAPCSSTVTSACISGFNVLTYASSSMTLVSTLPVPLPATVNTSGLTLSIPTGAYTAPASQVNNASYFTQMQVVYKDPSGATVQGGVSGGAYAFVVPGTFQPPPPPSPPRVTP